MAISIRDLHTSLYWENVYYNFFLSLQDKINLFQKRLGHPKGFYSLYDTLVYSHPKCRELGIFIGNCTSC